MKVVILLSILFGVTVAMPQRPFLPVQTSYDPQIPAPPPQIRQQYQPQIPQPVRQQYQFQQPITSSKDAVILKYDNEIGGDDELYSFGYETSDGQARQEQAVLKDAGTENEALSVTGSFSFLAPDGVVYTVRYIADENGFRPEGDHLPRRTPNVGIPAAALASLVGGGVGKK